MPSSSSPAPFTACLITFNEERNILAALESVSFADEIVVIDSRSTDRTRDIAETFVGRSRSGEKVSPRVTDRDWPGHVEQKNFAIDQATHDWVLCLDADERISPGARRKIEEILAKPSSAAEGYTLRRKTFYLGRWMLHGGWYPDRKLRLFRRSAGRWGGTNPHDHVQVEGSTRDLKGEILHYSYENLADHLKQINLFTDIAAREKHKRGVGFPVVRMLIQAPFKFFKMYLLQQGFRDGSPGFTAAILGAYYVFLKYAKLWELRSEQWRATLPEPSVASKPPLAGNGT